MKLILSRKGFDSGTGGCASPIFPDGSMLSLPIPSAWASHKMRDATSRNPNFGTGDVVADLSGLYNQATSVHFDPWLNGSHESTSARSRLAFGQDSSAQGHLRKEQVEVGDLFLFFGWFHEVERLKDKWTYKPDSPDLHVMFGWLQIDSILKVGGPDSMTTPGWLSEHPHVKHADHMNDQNTVYVGAKCLTVAGQKLGVAGGGTFDRFRNSLQLTAPGASTRSTWQLPRWFHPEPPLTPGNRRNLSYHRKDQGLWQLDHLDSPWTNLRSVARGQEFVIDVSGERGGPATEWLHSLFAAPASGDGAGHGC